MDKKHRRHVPRWRMGTGPLTNCGALIYCTATKRYLFLLRAGGSHGGTWGIAGGKIEASESVAQALYREISEEIGHDLSQNKTVPVEKFTSEPGNFVFHTFLITVDSEFIPELNSEHRGYCWVPLHDYPRPLHPGVWRTVSFHTVISKLETLQSIL